MFSVEKYRLVILDLDGVVYQDKDVIPGVSEAIERLRARDIHVVFNTNNSTSTREMYVERLRGMEIDTTAEDIFTSAYIATLALGDIYSPGTKVFVVGEIGLVTDLTEAGFTVTQDPMDIEGVSFVISGLDRAFTYDRLKAAAHTIMQGAEFYATNEDVTLPMPDLPWPGAGTMVAAISTATGRRPAQVFGKPAPDGINLILRKLGFSAGETLTVGDRFDTDIASGVAAGTDTLLVLTGIGKQEEVDLQSEISYPTFVLNSLADIE
jgi:4-nitrophenyl phosphatase